MGKLILLATAGAFIYFFIIKSRKTENIKNSDETEFIQCEKCQTFVLKKEMKEKNGKLLCKECYENS